MAQECTTGIFFLCLFCIIFLANNLSLYQEISSLNEQLKKCNQDQLEWASKQIELLQQQEADKLYWELEINALVQQQDDDKTKWKQDMNRQNLEWQSKYDEQIKKNRIDLENVQNTVSLNKLITSQMYQLDALYNTLGRKYKQILGNIEIYNNDINEINSEYKHIYQYHPDQFSESLSLNDEYIYNIVLLGETGHHKSTFGNRLCGDISFYAESSEFDTSTASTSCTKKFTKRIIKNLHTKIISVVDTPGFNDTDDDDLINAENLVSYLRGSGGIDAFVWITKETKFTKNYANSLQKLEDLLGKQFWRHLIFIRSTINDGTPAMRDHHIYSTKLRNSIRFRFELDDSYKLPIIALDTYYYYKKPIIEQFIPVIPHNKFQCDKISSPITKLIENSKEKRKDLYDFQLFENAIKNELNLLCDELNDSVNKMKTFDKGSYHIYSEKLLRIQNNAKKYDISSIDDQLMEIIEFPDQAMAEIDVKFIDFADKNYVESVLPFISELNETEIYDISKQCNIEINKMEEYVKYLYAMYPDSMITKDEICNLINNDVSNCKPCIHQTNIYDDNDNKECIGDNISQIVKPIHHKREEIINWNDWTTITIIILTFLIGLATIYICMRIKGLQSHRIKPTNEKCKEMDHESGDPDICDNYFDKISNPTDDPTDDQDTN